MRTYLDSKSSIGGSRFNGFSTECVYYTKHDVSYLHFTFSGSLLQSIDSLVVAVGGFQELTHRRRFGHSANHAIGGGPVGEQNANCN